MGKVRINCDNCGQFVWKYPYKLKRSDHLFCTKKCYSEFSTGKSKTHLKKEKITLICQCCGDEFKVSPCNKNRKFCGRKCADLSQTGKKADPSLQVSIVCENCGDIFTEYKSVIKYRGVKPKYCDQECMGEAFEGRKSNSSEGPPVRYPKTASLRRAVKARQRRRSLHDNYVKTILEQNGIEREFISQVMIEAKRIQIIAHRQSNDNLKITPELCQNVKSMSMTL